MSCQINVNHAFGPQQQKSLLSLSGQSEEKITFTQNWRLCYLFIRCDSPFLPGRSLHHQPFFYRHCRLTGAHANQSPAVLLPPDRVFSLQQANPTLLHPCQTFSWGFVEFRVFYCLEVFPQNRGCFYCNALIHFASQTGHSSSLRMRVNAEELHKDKSLVSVKSLNGYSTVKRVIILSFFAEQ